MSRTTPHRARATRASRPALTAAVALSTALLAALCAAGGAEARTVTAVPGDVTALAFAGDDLVVARQPLGRGLFVERRRAGAKPKLLLREAGVDRDEQVTLAASGQAVAVGLAGPSFTRSRVLVGPAAGPLRQVASCAGQGLAGPVAVFGSHVAWGQAGCGSAPAGLAIADADRAVSPRRIALPSVPATLVLAAGDSGLVTLAAGAPEASDVRAFGAGAIGASVASSSHMQAALGLLADGTRVVLGSEAGEPCSQPLVFTVAPGGGDRRPVDLGGPAALGSCLGAEALGGTGNLPRVTADRIVAVTLVRSRPTDEGEAFAIVSARADGGDRRQLARGDDVRAPGPIAADGDRVAWQQPACRGGSEVVVDSIASPSTYHVKHCRAEIRTHGVRVRDGHITVRVSCPQGCHGTADAARLIRSRSFAFGPGTHALRLRVALGSRRRAGIILRLHLDHGLPIGATIGIRR